MYIATIWTQEQKVKSVLPIKYGKLSLNCLKGQRLRDCDTFTKQDPFVQAEYNNKKYKTEIIHQGGTDVEWNHPTWEFENVNTK